MSSTPSSSECNGTAGSDTPVHHFSVPTGIALDQATGELYVLDGENGVVDVFGVKGEYLSQILLPASFSPENTPSVAVSGLSHHVYVADVRPPGVVYEFGPTGSLLGTWTGANTPAGSFARGEMGVAVDDGTGNRAG
jgi:DNA-binding beta-propeller fold protein YncE